MESTGSVWTNLHNRLDEKRIHMALANTLKLKAIVSAKIKSTKVDARILAHGESWICDACGECCNWFKVPVTMHHGAQKR